MGTQPHPVFLAAAGIQSPFPHPNTWGNAGVVHIGPVCLAKRRGGLRILTWAIEIKGSGFPLRRERRGVGHPKIGSVNAIAPDF